MTTVYEVSALLKIISHRCLEFILKDYSFGSYALDTFKPKYLYRF